ncbi:hypothetical protein L7F22_046287 [Adiantum nelumboides]|nr:hypothetical protein [Adiantum nelumboides]
MYNTQGTFEASSAAGPALRTPTTGPYEQAQQADLGTSLLYRCKKCRRIVASQENALTHEQEGGQIPVRKKGKGSRGVDAQTVDCTSVFVEPMQWMTTDTVAAGFTVVQVLNDPKMQAGLLKVKYLIRVSLCHYTTQCKKVVCRESCHVQVAMRDWGVLTGLVHNAAVVLGSAEEVAHNHGQFDITLRAKLQLLGPGDRELNFRMINLLVAPDGGQGFSWDCPNES